ncbi:putative RNA-binding protein (contains KH domain) [Rivularia sp. PCC 7116]|uniref:KH domain-containing protein n=1 Tax=Rivularia sp. PCC 7116 TaxID=373994 RepID=UPI00029F150A|nr:KH domain-containing protein [Rivularia sp. PCC 7116]AFY52951.1 putative RNA-binding protein (contains KH domain) [Rivularia sp. PCC 7116]
MFLNKSVQQLHPSKVTDTNSRTTPDYVGLVNFLMQPFLESPESLSVDCEISRSTKRAWIRIAFDSADKGKVFGRGGRNIQAIRTVISAAAQAAGQSAYLDIYGSNESREDAPASYSEERDRELPMPKPKVRRGDGRRDFTKPRTRI